MAPNWPVVKPGLRDINRAGPTGLIQGLYRTSTGNLDALWHAQGVVVGRR